MTWIHYKLVKRFWMWFSNQTIYGCRKRDKTIRRAVCFLLYYDQCTIIIYKIVNDHLKFQINYWNAKQREMSILKKCLALFYIITICRSSSYKLGNSIIENISHDRHAAVTRYLEHFKILIRHNSCDRSWIFS